MKHSCSLKDACLEQHNCLADTLLQCRVLQPCHSTTGCPDTCSAAAAWMMRAQSNTTAWCVQLLLHNVCC
jgi:hypothetical protein